MSFSSIAQMLFESEKNQLPLWKTILQDNLAEQGGTEKDFFARMQSMWTAMQESSKNYKAEDRSNSGLTGGDGAKVFCAAQKGLLFGDSFLNEIITEALKVSECNACMKRIVATPTAGSCGVLPAILLPLKRRDLFPDDSFVKALFVAAGFGQVIAQRASIAGAYGGCQAEIGAASAMGAAALVSLKGGTNQMCANACAVALSNLMGLVCDPVAGLVEVPCVNRNVIGAMNALSCANLALSNIQSRIPPDEVIDAMNEVGEEMNPDLKETGKGGLAGTPTGCKIAQKLSEEKDYL
ncbi:MAG: L-serine ammonia-lyase, iron-sulfur-dependent, subunit alpha [Clostridiales bacterium]|jgi:L-serine dehydratase|nr:L-serine ammonia-lyase, iron-sulfur-dependent, subunit alpha [Clostridiales bacterium]MCI2161760.1 L-serine ammonia-lyase, iron-sulfur-dependent, subunit alpha [Oscillospiraceae bacterium]MCI1960549.1 L-serine ammonia-lyase, iron-sulfur-dependent, subunit alpha [Clostridiales bacterium]MCI2021036.1 L-serine ammonia-lyase, iron-sulfur-dependent, subunit alpha [Clostridiales bacterium]MCI2025419.1 L-serine ammonia-lyase, iron-sulfur-dependent, subunit alpha [Clostridiales bacterium]